MSAFFISITTEETGYSLEPPESSYQMSKFNKKNKTKNICHTVSHSQAA